MNDKVQEALTNIFMAVADAYDGGDELCDDVRKAYADEFEKPEVQAFYGELIDENPMNELIP